MDIIRRLINCCYGNDSSEPSNIRRRNRQEQNQLYNVEEVEQMVKPTTLNVERMAYCKRIQLKLPIIHEARPFICSHQQEKDLINPKMADVYEQYLRRYYQPTSRDLPDIDRYYGCCGRIPGDCVA